MARGEAWYQQTDTEGLSGDDGAWGLRLRSPNHAGLRVGIGVKEIQADFNPALGFANKEVIAEPFEISDGVIIPKAGREMFIVLNHNLEDFNRTNSFHSLGGVRSYKDVPSNPSSA